MTSLQKFANEWKLYVYSNYGTYYLSDLDKIQRDLIKCLKKHVDKK